MDVTGVVVEMRWVENELATWPGLRIENGQYKEETKYKTKNS